VSSAFDMARLRAFQQVQHTDQREPADADAGEQQRQYRPRQVAPQIGAFQPGAGWKPCSHRIDDVNVTAGVHVPSSPLVVDVKNEPASLAPGVSDLTPASVPRTPWMVEHHVLGLDFQRRPRPRYDHPGDANDPHRLQRQSRAKRDERERRPAIVSGIEEYAQAPSAGEDADFEQREHNRDDESSLPHPHRRDDVAGHVSES
jgi:hypothetical protein